MEKILYDVQWKTIPSEFDPKPEWRSFMGYTPDLKTAKEDFKTVVNNPRCWKAKLVTVKETFIDMPEFCYEREL